MLEEEMQKVYLTKILKNIEIKENDIKVVMEELAFARDLGDFRENDELSIANSKLEMLSNELNELHETAQRLEKVNTMNGIIDTGVLLKVRQVDPPTKEEADILLFDAEINEVTMFDGILSANSPLGAKIHGKKPGIFDVNGYRFSVKFAKKEDVPKYNTMYALTASGTIEMLLNKMESGVDENVQPRV